MRVLSVSAKNQAGRQSLGTPAESFDAAANDTSYTRIAFAGRTERGKAGVACVLNENRITGHKLDPIPRELVDLVQHFSITQMREGLQAAARGENVLIGSEQYGLLINWVGLGFEVFSAGEDSE